MKQEPIYSISIDNMLNNVAICKIKDNVPYIEDLNHLAEITEKVIKEDVVGQKLLDVFPSAKTSGLYDIVRTVYKTGQSEALKFEIYQDNHISGWRENYISKLDTDLIMIVYRDFSVQQNFERMELEEKLEEKKRKKEIENHLELINRYVMISETDLQGTITHASQAFCDLTGYSKEELIGKNHRILRCKEVDPKVFEVLWKTISSDHIWEGELKSRSKEGIPFWAFVTISPKRDAKGEKIGYTAIRQNITAKKMYETFSMTDGLTGISNRRYFDEVFQSLVNIAKREDRLVSLLMLDADNFKQYNDRYGHSAGDEVLVKIAKAMKKRFQRGGDYCFRLGGEEFCILTISKSKEVFYALAEQLKNDIEALAIPHQNNNASAFVTVSIGALSQEALKVNDIKTLYQEVDVLLYRAKGKGRNQIVYM